MVIFAEQLMLHGGAPCGARAATASTPPVDVSWTNATTLVGAAAETRPMKNDDWPGQMGVAKVKVIVLPTWSALARPMLPTPPAVTTYTCAAALLVTKTKVPTTAPKSMAN